MNFKEILKLRVEAFVQELMNKERTLKTTLAMVVSNWTQPIAGLQLTPSQFYEEVARRLAEGGLPGTQCLRLWKKEGSFWGPEREYLRVGRERTVYDICVAPSGSGCFISCWLCIVPFTLSLTHLCGMWFTLIFMPGLSPKWTLILFLWIMFNGWMWWTHSKTITNTSNLKDMALGLTLIGPFLKAWASRRPTYYQLDTAGIFQTQVQEVLTDMINELCKSQNLRTLSELERKPTSLEFMRR